MNWDKIYRTYSLREIPWHSEKVPHSLVRSIKNIKKGFALDVCCGAGANSIYVDFLSNGVKMRSTDSELNGTLIYWAIAERPFVSSTGIPTTAR